MQLTRAQLIALSAAVVVACAGGFALGHASAPDAPPRLPDVAAQRATVKPVGDPLLVPPAARLPR
jgi:hypothetical protein